MSHDYYVVMVDHKALGRQGLVDPKLTRQDIVDSLRNDGWSKAIAAIHHVTVDEAGFGHASDVTNEILRESGFYDTTLEDVDELLILRSGQGQP